MPHIDLRAFAFELIDAWPRHLASSSTIDVTAGQDSTILMDASSGSLIVDLPAAEEKQGTNYYIKKTDSSTNSVTIQPESDDLIDGEDSYSFDTQYQSVHIYSDGENWWILNRGEEEVMSQLLVQIYDELRALRTDMERVLLHFSFVTDESVEDKDVN